VRNFLPPQSQEPEIFLLEKLIEKQVDAKESNGELFGDKEGKMGKRTIFNSNPKDKSKK